MHQHQRVIHYHTGESKHAQQAHHRQGKTHKPVPKHCTNHPKGDHTHHKQWLGVALEWQGQHAIDRKEREHQSQLQTTKRLPLLSCLAFHPVADAGVLQQQLVNKSANITLQQRHVGLGFFNFCSDIDGPKAVNPIDGTGTNTGCDLCNLKQGHLRTCRGSYQHILESIKTGPL